MSFAIELALFLLVLVFAVLFAYCEGYSRAREDLLSRWDVRGRRWAWPHDDYCI